MTVRLYKSTDASAPSLTGQVGSLVALLDAVLVNGYGSQTAAGWTKAYSATNKASYRMVTSGNTGFYLDVDDSAPTTAKEARMRGYEVMTALATGTNAFPTVAQSSFGVVCRKSNTADATARPWYCVADGSVFYLFVDTGDFTLPAYSMAFTFGDFFSYKSGDAYNCQIQGRIAENDSSNGSERLPLLECGWNMFGGVATRTGQYLARVWTGTGGSTVFYKVASSWSYYAGGSSQPRQVMGASQHLLPYPNGPDGGLVLSPVFITHSNGLRGYLKGLWNPCHNQPLGHGDTFSGTGNMNGKSFLMLNMQTGSDYTSATGQVAIETTDTWS